MINLPEWFDGSEFVGDLTSLAVPFLGIAFLITVYCLIRMASRRL